MTENKNKPLEGVRVLDFTHAAAGPYCTMFLADMGAEVIKIEKPGRGDGSRYMGEPMVGPLDSDYYISLNRNKKSVLIDLSLPEGKKLAQTLASKSDIVVQNFRPGVMERLGLGYEDLKKVKKELIYCSISAFGSSGPWSKRPANDIIMQSVSGLMGITGEVGGGPVRIGAPISDYSSGLFALSGILAALYSRNRYPEGQHIEVSMLDASMAMMANYVPSVVTLGKTIPRLGRGHAQIVPYQAFRCSDDEFVMVGAFTNGFWQNLCRAVSKPEWIDNPNYLTNALRLEHREELLSQLEEIFLQKSREEWLEILEKADVPNSPVFEFHDAIRSEQIKHNETVREVEYKGKSAHVVSLPIKSKEWDGNQDTTFPPFMGTHTKEVFHTVLGMKEQQIDEYAEKGIIAFQEGE